MHMRKTDVFPASVLHYFWNYIISKTPQNSQQIASLNNDVTAHNNLLV